MCLYMGTCVGADFNESILFSYYNAKPIEGIKTFNCHCEFVIPPYKQIKFPKSIYTHYNLSYQC